MLLCLLVKNLGNGRENTARKLVLPGKNWVQNTHSAPNFTQEAVALDASASTSRSTTLQTVVTYHVMNISAARVPTALHLVLFQQGSVQLPQANRQEIIPIHAHHF